MKVKIKLLLNDGVIIHIFFVHLFTIFTLQKQPSRGILGIGVLKICSKFTGKYPCRSMISIKFQSNFIEITFGGAYSLVNLLHIFREPFYENTYEGMLIIMWKILQNLQGNIFQNVCGAGVFKQSFRFINIWWNKIQ